MLNDRILWTPLAGSCSAAVSLAARLAMPGRNGEIRFGLYEQIESLLPRQRGNVSLTILPVLSAILYIAAPACKWGGLPRRL